MPQRKRVNGILFLPPPSSPPPLQESSHLGFKVVNMGLMQLRFACSSVAGRVLVLKPVERAGVQVPWELCSPILPWGTTGFDLSHSTFISHRHSFSFLFRLRKVVRNESESDFFPPSLFSPKLQEIKKHAIGCSKHLQQTHTKYPGEGLGSRCRPCS